MPSAQDRSIYLDHNATTPIAPEVREAMLPFLGEAFGNPSSGYPLGRQAKEALEEARADVARLLGCKPQEIVFTSGGSEANNMALKGRVDFRRPAAFHLVTTAVEHPAILNPALYLGELGARVTVLPVDGRGRVDPEAVRRALGRETGLISVMLANNETGTLQPIPEIAAIAAEQGTPVHTDAAQAVGKIPVDVNVLGVAFLSLAGHKLYAPKGVGVLYIREGCELTPLIHGAAQESGRRAGTENVLLAVGLGAACRLAAGTLTAERRRIEHLRDTLQELLFAGIDGLILNGDPRERLPNTLNVSVPGLQGGRILEALPGIMASTGAACHDRSVALSHVLSAMGIEPATGMGALRLSLGRSNTLDQITEAAGLIIDQVKRMDHERL